MNPTVEHIEAQTFHGRKGAVKNAFRYSIDYVLLDAEADLSTPTLFGRNTRGLTSVQDVDHGGAPGRGRGAVWVRDVLKRYRITGVERVELLAQPRVLGYVFNPVSFWLCRDAGGQLIAVICEVTNTYGDRNSYLCVKSDGTAILPEDRITADKILHVSPFQPVEGGYVFRFDITDERIGVWIDYSRGKGGLTATLTGVRKPISNRSILRAMLRRPFGARRVLTLIHWQALKLWWKGATFRNRPEPTTDEVSR